jgi:hypothetical protein
MRLRLLAQGELLGSFISDAAACRSGSSDDTADATATSGGANFFELPGLSCAACHFPVSWPGSAGNENLGHGEGASRAEPRARGAPSPAELVKTELPSHDGGAASTSEDGAEAEAEAAALCVVGDLQGRVHFLRLRPGLAPVRDPVDRIVGRCCGHIAHFDW